MDWMSPKLKLICLKGNHEDMMWHCCRHPIRAGWWMENGSGRATLVSYGQREGEPVDVTVVPEQHLRWMESNSLRCMSIGTGCTSTPASIQTCHSMHRIPGAFVEALQGRRRPAWSRHAACRAWPSSIQERPDYDRRPNQPRHACLAHWQAGCRSFRRRRSRRTGVPSRGSWRASRDKTESSGKGMTPIAELISECSRPTSRQRREPPAGSSPDGRAAPPRAIPNKGTR